jgi:hypothetical protein
MLDDNGFCAIRQQLSQDPAEEEIRGAAAEDL